MFIFLHFKYVLFYSVYLLFPLEETLSIHPTGGRVQSGVSLLISGLCYSPGVNVRCDFGELGTVAGRKVNGTKAVCSVPLTTTSKEVTLFVYFKKDSNFKMAQVFFIGKLNLWLYG